MDAVPGGVRMVATDLDGTLLRPDNTVSARTVAAFAAARAAGLPVVFVTGRPPRWLPPVVEATGHAGIGVCANGALVVDLDTHEVLETHPLPHDAIVETVGILRAEIEGVAFALEWDSPPASRRLRARAVVPRALPRRRRRARRHPRARRTASGHQAAGPYRRR